MPTFQGLIDLDARFRQLPFEPVIINDLANTTEEDRENIRSLIMSRYTGDMMTLIPQCRCGAIKGAAWYGDVCSVCHEPVQSSLEKNLQSQLWFRKPDGVAPLISPVILTMLVRRFNKKNFNIIAWLIDPSYQLPTKERPTVLQKILDAGFKRGYNEFVENFDDLMEFLFSFKALEKKEGEYTLYDLIREYRPMIFSDYIPLPNKSIFIVENTHVGRFVDDVVMMAMNFLTMMTSIDKDFYHQNARMKINRTAKALLAYSDFFVEYIEANLNPKPAIVRQHIMGSRMTLTARAVITAIVGPHDHEELEIPWGIAITILKPFITNKLVRHGMSYNNALGYINAHVEKFDQRLHEILREIIEIESTNGYLTVIFQRNPSLLPGSAQTFRWKWTNTKTDPTDRTIGISPSVVKAPNADYDGDQMNLTLAPDQITAERWESLRPHFNVLELDKPYQVSGNVQIYKPMVSMISNYLNRR